VRDIWEKADCCPLAQSSIVLKLDRLLEEWQSFMNNVRPKAEAKTKMTKENFKRRRPGVGRE